VVLCLAMVALGIYLVVRSMRRMHQYDRLIAKIKSEHSIIAEYIE